MNTDFKEIESEVNNMMCSKYCSDEEFSGGGFHACDENDFIEHQGIDVKNISERYDPIVNDFIKTYPCNVCEFKCEDEEEIKLHIKTYHKEMVFKIGCLNSECNFKANKPDNLTQHVKENHRELVYELVKIYKESKGY